MPGTSSQTLKQRLNRILGLHFTFIYLLGKRKKSLSNEISGLWVNQSQTRLLQFTIAF